MQTLHESFAGSQHATFFFFFSQEVVRQYIRACKFSQTWIIFFLLDQNSSERPQQADSNTQNGACRMQQRGPGQTKTHPHTEDRRLSKHPLMVARSFSVGSSRYNAHWHMLSAISHFSHIFSQTL